MFGLLAARFFPQDVNLRQLWADALDTTLLKRFGADPYYAAGDRRRGTGIPSSAATSCAGTRVANQCGRRHLGHG
ncbi:MAG: hypothetical protein IPK19_41415 [Chloroflexi bacterium]|nr:hypothetical protein [Chloroflexota bacterium]